MAYPAAVGGRGGCAALPPWWISSGVKPEGPPRNMGTWTAVSFSPAQMAQFGVSAEGTVVDAAKHGAALQALKAPQAVPAQAAPVKALPPWWILNGVKPEGPERDMGTSKAISFSAAQQAQFGVSAEGQVVDAAKHSAALLAMKAQKAAPAPAAGVKAMPPWWILNGVKPEGPERDMGTWKACSFSAAQQAQFGVSAEGQIVDAGKHEAGLREHKARGGPTLPQEAAELISMPTGDVSLEHAVSYLHAELGDALRVCILGGTAFHGADSERLTTELAKRMAEEFTGEVIFVTGGMKGVQETFAKACGDGSNVYNLLPMGESSGFGTGKDVHAGKNLDQRKKIFGAMGDVYVTVEGGPGVAQEAGDAFKRGAGVVPLIRTGAASSGMFNFPPAALETPDWAQEIHWKLLADKDAPVEACAAAVTSLLRAFVEHRSGGGSPKGVGSMTPGYATALLKSNTLLTNMCSRFFKKYDVNGNGLLEISEVTSLATEMHGSLGVPKPSKEELQASLAGVCSNASGLSAAEFPTWFSSFLRASLERRGK